MKTSALERTYVSIADAQRTADTFNAFVEWIKNVEGFHPVRELRPMYFGEDAPSYLFNSHTSQVAHWMHKLWEADLVEVEFHFEEKTFTQYFMPYKAAGYVKNASRECVLNLELTDGKGTC